MENTIYIIFLHVQYIIFVIIIITYICIEEFSETATLN